MVDQSLILLAVPESAAFELRVNFGVLAGREATRAELDRLARELQPLLGTVTIVAERRVVLDDEMEAEVHQVRIDLDGEAPLPEVVTVAEAWATECFAERHAEITEP